MSDQSNHLKKSPNSTTLDTKEGKLSKHDQVESELLIQLRLIDEQVAQYDEADTSSGRVELLERAVKLVEQHQDIDLTLKYSLEITSALFYSEDWDLFFIYFPKLIKILDESPQKVNFFEMLQILFRYKWFIEHSLNYPQIPISRIHALCDDLETRLLNRNYSIRPVIFFRQKLDETTRTGESSLEHLENALHQRIDVLSDCRACEENLVISSYFKHGSIDQGIDVFERMIAQGMSCHAVPHISYAQVGVQLLRRGDEDRGDELFRKGWSMISSFARKNQSIIDQHIAYFAKISDFDLVLSEIGSRVFEIWELTNCPKSRMESCAYMAFTLQTLYSSGVTHFEGQPVLDPQIQYEEEGFNVQTLGILFSTQAREISQRFDQRNGNTRESEEIDHLIATGGFIHPVQRDFRA